MARSFRQGPAGHRGSRVLSLLLCLMLALAPLAGAATPWPPATTHDSGNPPSPQMPCHAAAGPSTEAADAGTTPAQADCPHCAGEAAPSSCHCCGQTAPAGIGGRLSRFRAERIGLALAEATPVDPLPDSPTRRLFRPPIFPR